MRLLRTKEMCERFGMAFTKHTLARRARLTLGALSGLLFAGGFPAFAQSANSSAGTNAAPVRVESAAQKLDESAFRIVSDRNIFNANRSGGTVRVGSSRRPVRIESFTLVGTMAYDKGVFAFFEGTNSEFTKALKPEGIIAGYKITDILANAVKLEGDGKEFELSIGSQMRREDEGAWHVAEASGSGGYSGGSSGYTSSRSYDSNSRNNRFNRSSGNGRRGNTSEPEVRSSTIPSSSSSEDASEVLKRLMEQRAKESQ